MGKCKFCRRDAGFLRGEHAECRRSNAEGVEAIAALVSDRGLPAVACAEQMRHLSARHHVSRQQRKDALAAGWRSCVAAGLAGGELGPEEEERLATLLEEFDVSRRYVDPGGLWGRVRSSRRAAGKARVGELVLEMLRPASTEGAGAELDSVDGASKRSLAAIEDEIKLVAETRKLSIGELRDAVLAGFEAELRRIVDSERLTADQEEAVEAALAHFRIGEKELNRNGAHDRFVLALVLRDLADGVVSQRQKLEREDLPFRLQEAEKLVWVFRNVDYGTIEVSQEVVMAGGHGFSYDEVRGVDDTGRLGVTTRHIYFAGEHLRFRIRYDRIVSIEPRSDGFWLMRDHEGAEPEVFLLSDGEFAYELLRSPNLAAVAPADPG